MKVKLGLLLIVFLNAITFSTEADLLADIKILAEIKKLQAGKDELVCHYNRLAADSHDWVWNFSATVQSIGNKHLEYIPFGAQIHCVLETQHVNLTVPSSGDEIKKEIPVVWKRPITYFEDAFCKANQPSNPSHYGPTFKVLFECNVGKLPVTIRSAIKKVKSFECDGTPKSVH